MSDTNGGPTEYGFEWGPMAVERIAKLPASRRVLRVATPHHKVEIYSSRTGSSVRVYLDGVEMKADK